VNSSILGATGARLLPTLASSNQPVSAADAQEILGSSNAATL